jgi:MFS family permease
MGAIVFFTAAVLGCMLSGTLATKAMERWNSRLRAITIGVVTAPICVILGAFLSAQFYSDVELRTGGMFALGLMTIFAAGLTAFVGGLIAAFIAIGLKQPVDTVWSSEDGDTHGYRSNDDTERYG